MGFVLIFLVPAFAPSVRAGENEIELATLMSKYYWRGLRLSEGPVYQASGTISYKGFSFNMWGNVDFHDGRFSETDLTGAYAHNIRKFTLETGVIHYAMMKAHDTTEIYVDFYGDLPLQPEVALYYDVNLGTGAFLQSSIGHSFTLSKRVSLDVKSSLGIVFQDGNMGIPDNGQEFTGLYNADIQVSCPVKLTEHWSFTWKAGASTPLSRNARQAIRNGSIWDREQGSFNGTVVFGGATLNYSF